MTRSFDPSSIFSLLPSYWRDFYKDRAKLVRFWEALTRLMDDEYARIEQMNDSGSLISCPSLLYHTYLYRKLDAWMSYGVPHAHFRKDFRASTGQTIFYVGDWVDPASTRVYLNGQETDPLVSPYTITLDQDGTQPGTNPSGARVIFDNPVSGGSPVSIVSDKKVFRGDYEVGSGGLSSISFPAEVDPFSVKISIEKVNLTRFLTLSASSFTWKVFPSTTGVTDQRVFRKGEVFEVVDAGTVQRIYVSSESQTVSIPNPVNPATAVVYKMVGLDITSRSIEVDGSLLRSKNQPFPVSSIVRIADVVNSVGRVVETSISEIDFGRDLDEDSLRAYLYGGIIGGGYTADDLSLVFDRSFMEGVVLRVSASLVLPNDHAHHRVVTSGVTQQVSVPTTRPFNLTPTLAEKEEYPVLVFMNGHLLHPDKYSFTSTTTILLTIPVTGGTLFDFYYIDLEDPEQHLHVSDSIRVTTPTSAFHLEDYVSERFEPMVVINGSVVSDPSKIGFSPDGQFLNTFQPVTGGSLVRVHGAHYSLRFYHQIDSDIIRAAYLQNGIDQKSESIPNGWTIQLAWENGFNIEDGLLESDQAIEDAWFVDAYVDERIAFRNFGALIDFDRETSDEYVRVLRALMSGSYAGSHPAVIEDLVCIILGSEYLTERSKITAVRRDGTIEAGDQTYTYDTEVGPNVDADREYRRYKAVSAFAEVDDDWDSFDEIALIAPDFSDDYLFAKTFDIHRPTTYDGPSCTYDYLQDKILDFTTDFFEEEIWPGDLIVVYTDAQPSVPIYGRILKVERHRLQTTIDFGSTGGSYGAGYYGQWAYGRGSFILPLDRYRIWNRNTDRLDLFRHLDEALPEDIPYLKERFKEVLSTFTFLVTLQWAAVKDPTALRDVTRNVDRLKPEEQRAIILARVLDSGFEDALAGDVTDGGLAITEEPNYAFVSSTPEIISIVGQNGQILNPNVGSFLGP